MHLQVSILLQIALILGVARILGELFRRLNQPPVLGELLAGIVLGPSLLGALAPQAFEAIFLPASRHAAAHGGAAVAGGTIELLSTMGLILLMFLTGLETDIRVMRNMGRAAFTSSVCGLLIPFASGYLLGMFLDEGFVGPHGRLPLALFLATAMAVSAMPVISKILMDLNMLQRNFGILILSAAVVDDCVGWIVLAAIAGLVTKQSFEPLAILQTLSLLAAFVASSRYLLFPLMRWLLPRAEQALRMPNSELVVMAVTAFLCAAATEAMQVHAVFGAFVAGVVFRQCPALNPKYVHQLESVTMALFAPLFFSSVGLRVDLTRLTSLALPALVIAVAILGKIIGCYLGGIIGRLPRWEALAMGLGMSARGAVGLVVAKIGLDLEIIDNELFSAVVMMAVVTSLLTPLTLRAIAHKLPLSEEEKLRVRSSEGGFVPHTNLKILLPAGGGNNALIGCHMAAHLCGSQAGRVVAVHFETGRGPGILARLWRTRSASSTLDTQAYFERLRASAIPYANALSPRQIRTGENIQEAILKEAAKNYQFLFLGASGQEHPLYDPFVSTIVKRSPCHMVVVSGWREEAHELPFKRILVPTNGSYFSEAAFELAARYAEASEAHLTVLYVAESGRRNPLLPAAAVGEVSEHVQDLMRITLRQQYSEQLKHPERLECLVRESESVVTALVDEIGSRRFDLVILGAENKRLVERLYLGQHIEEAMTMAPCPIAVVIPKVGALAWEREPARG